MFVFCRGRVVLLDGNGGDEGDGGGFHGGGVDTSGDDDDQRNEMGSSDELSEYDCDETIRTRHGRGVRDTLWMNPFPYLHGYADVSCLLARGLSSTYLAVQE